MRVVESNVIRHIGRVKTETRFASLVSTHRRPSGIPSLSRSLSSLPTLFALIPVLDDMVVRVVGLFDDLKGERPLLSLPATSHVARRQMDVVHALRCCVVHSVALHSYFAPYRCPSNLLIRLAFVPPAYSHLANGWQKNLVILRLLPKEHFADGLEQRQLLQRAS